MSSAEQLLDARLTALGELWAVWAAHGRDLDAARWARPTRLDGWDVKALFAHLAAWPHGFAHMLSLVRTDEPTHDSATSLLRDLNRPGGLAALQAPRVAQGAREAAGQYRPEQLTAAFATVGPDALAEARRLGPVVVEYFGIARLALAEAAGIGVVESTVHLLDLQRALGREPSVPASGLAQTAEILAAIPHPVAFIEAATGRGTGTLFPLVS
ncbi:maleylpyruvate isomerase family mycothiol-dependent enzyme [Catenuloplanes japonicus]|uniref:maleylpyruvate isomerase family mycothiol-dependent enzyme n=1 Tax=Catenuloplanes japonicus TaxID=33876 RepID=UPI00052765C7|nr:maleylpyruvate isomerase family mycothiol-dependent enzyme [Catenuloplanes japonicus]